MAKRGYNAMKIRTFIALALAGALAGLLTAACSDEKPGPATQAGQAVDRASQNVKDAIDPGPAQKAGRSIDRALGN
jgi:hypothetical protein